MPDGVPAGCGPSIGSMVDDVRPATGWAVLHLFCKPEPSGVDAEAVTSAVKTAVADGVQAVPVALLGHKADVGLMLVGPELWRLRRLQTAVTAAGLAVVDSYLSL